MLIPYETLESKYGIKPKGVIHLGASHGEEADAYNKAGLANQVWVEAIPEIFEKLQNNLSHNSLAIPLLACLSDVTGTAVTFNVTNNDGQSSSFLLLKDHKIHHPTVVVNQTIDMVTITMDDIISGHKLDMTKYDFLNIDLQGAELKALKGMRQNLKYINYVYCEVNTAELYEGCPMVEEIDSFLSANGFEAIEVLMTDSNWGDKFYMRNSAAAKAGDEIEQCTSCGWKGTDASKQIVPREQNTTGYACPNCGNSDFIIQSNLKKLLSDCWNACVSNMDRKDVGHEAFERFLRQKGIEF